MAKGMDQRRNTGKMNIHRTLSEGAANTISREKSHFSMGLKPLLRKLSVPNPGDLNKVIYPGSHESALKSAVSSHAYVPQFCTMSLP